MRCTNTQVVRHSEPGLFSVTAIPLGVRQVQHMGARDRERFGGGWEGVLGLDAGGTAELACSEVCVGGGGSRDKAMITHNENCGAR